MLRSHPIEGLVENWFFRSREESAGVFVVEGQDVWGRTVSLSGTDPEEMLSSCVASAREINNRFGGELV